MGRGEVVGRLGRTLCFGFERMLEGLRDEGGIEVM